MQGIAQVAVGHEDVLILSICFGSSFFVDNKSRTTGLHLQSSNDVVAAGGLFAKVFRVDFVVTATGFQQDACLHKILDDLFDFLPPLLVKNTSFGGNLFVVVFGPRVSAREYFDDFIA